MTLSDLLWTVNEWKTDGDTPVTVNGKDVDYVDCSNGKVNLLLVEDKEDNDDEKGED